jgi:hypothetical protein
MAFKTVQQKKQTTAADGSTSQTKAFVPLITFNTYEKEGKRIVRWFAAEYGEKDPQEPHTGYSLWLDINTREQGQRKIRVWVDKQTKYALPDPKQARYRFIANVYDRTPVYLDENGAPIYPNLQNQYKGVTTKDKPKPHNRVMVYEGGFDLLRKIEALDDTTYDDEGQQIRLVDFDIALSRVGLTFEDTQYNANETTRRDVLGADVFNLPRYDLDRYTKTLHFDHVVKLMNGEIWEEVMEDIMDEYDFQLKLKENDPDAPF